MKIRVADYMAEFLAVRHMDTIFTIVGGGAMHLNDAFGKHPAIRSYYNHNEQACGMAAEGYTRISGKIGVICVTTGPGGTNAISGVLGAWLDSIPMLVISGQVKYETTVRGAGLPLRQMGDQEFDITKCVETLTKYAYMVTDPKEIRFHMEKAVYLAERGRPGPCWLDIPMNVQSAIIETDELLGFDPKDEGNAFVSFSDSGSRYEHTKIEDIAVKVAEKIYEAKRPVIYIGNGVHIAGCEKAMVELSDKLQIPVVAGFNAHDIFAYEHPLYIGRPGTIGDRAGNFAVQNADLLLVIGCRLNIRQIGYNWNSFARAAYKIMVDIDKTEMEKPSIMIDMKIQSDVKDFIEAMNGHITGILAKCGEPAEKAGITGVAENHADWLSWCLKRKDKYPTVLPEYWEREELINPYCFMEALGEHMGEGDVVAAANATACVCSFQALKVKKGQRIYSNSGSASMGYDLPAAIGSAVAMRGNRFFGDSSASQDGADAKIAGDGKTGNIICLAGDGSIQMNIQELQTIVHYRLPIKIFVLNNNGYHSIRQTQRNFFGEQLVGCEPESGVSFPDMQRLAIAYGIPFNRMDSHSDMEGKIEEALHAESCFISEVMLTADQPFAPKPSSVRLDDGRMVSQPLENLAPFLSREEFLENMIIEPEK